MSSTCSLSLFNVLAGIWVLSFAVDPSDFQSLHTFVKIVLVHPPGPVLLPWYMTYSRPTAETRICKCLVAVVNDETMLAVRKSRRLGQVSLLESSFSR